MFKIQLEKDKETKTYIIFEEGEWIILLNHNNYSRSIAVPNHMNTEYSNGNQGFYTISANRTKIIISEEKALESYCHTPSILEPKISFDFGIPITDEDYQEFRTLYELQQSEFEKMSEEDLEARNKTLLQQTRQEIKKHQKVKTPTIPRNDVPPYKRMNY